MIRIEYFSSKVKQQFNAGRDAAPLEPEATKLESTKGSSAGSTPLTGAPACEAGDPVQVEILLPVGAVRD
jgi:hypothetical protein